MIGLLLVSALQFGQYHWPFASQDIAQLNAALAFVLAFVLGLAD
jgi:uncharacterized membrane protein (Fun14 family)